MGNEITLEQARLLRQMLIRVANDVADDILLTENQMDKFAAEKLIGRQNELRIRFVEVAKRLSLVEEVIHMDSPEITAKKISLSEIEIDPEIIQIVPRHVARRYKIIPIKMHEGGYLVIALSNQTNFDTLDSLQYILKVKVKGIIATPEDIEEALKKYYSGKDPMEFIP